MNHRMGKRITVDFPVTVHAVDRGPIAARMMNLSLSGAGLVVDRCDALERYSAVELTLEWPLGDNSERTRIEGFVVRKQDRTIGIMFMRDMVRLVRRLRADLEYLDRVDPSTGPSAPPRTRQGNS